MVPLLLRGNNIVSSFVRNINQFTFNLQSRPISYISCLSWTFNLSWANSKTCLFLHPFLLFSALYPRSSSPPFSFSSFCLSSHATFSHLCISVTEVSAWKEKDFNYVFLVVAKFIFIIIISPSTSKTSSLSSSSWSSRWIFFLYLGQVPLPVSGTSSSSYHHHIIIVILGTSSFSSLCYKIQHLLSHTRGLQYTVTLLNKDLKLILIKNTNISWFLVFESILSV